MRRRRSRGSGSTQVSHERWLVSYADFMTLLFAFFTTMYAISTVDAQKLTKMVSSMQMALNGAADAPHPVQPPATDRVLARGGAEREALNELRMQLAERLRRQIDTGNVALEVDPRGLVVSIREAGSFTIGSADLSDAARTLLTEIGGPLAELTNPVRVEGHTDDVPIHTPRFRSNWELSTARATSVITFLVEEVGIDAARLSAAGYGEFKPRSANDDDTARAQNRRVDLVILNAATQRAEEPEAGAGAGAGAE
jgi:chemotaxis protein MotB